MEAGAASPVGAPGGWEGVGGAKGLGSFQRGFTFSPATRLITCARKATVGWHDQDARG